MSKKRKGYCLQVLEASLDIEVTVNLQNLQNYFDFSKVAYFRPTRPTDLQTIYIFLLFNYKIFIYKGLGFWFCGFGCRFSVGFLQVVQDGLSFVGKCRPTDLGEFKNRPTKFKLKARELRHFVGLQDMQVAKTPHIEKHIFLPPRKTKKL